MLEGVPVIVNIMIKKLVNISVTEEEMMKDTKCLQDIIYVQKFIKSIGLHVKLPMKLHLYINGELGLFNNWCSSGRKIQVDKHTLGYVN